MNYIKQLQEGLAGERQRLAAVEESVRLFRGHLHSDKFAGRESDGGRKDWIATGDVLAWLQGLNRIE